MIKCFFFYYILFSFLNFCFMYEYILVNDMKLKYIHCILNNKMRWMKCMKFCETHWVYDVC